MLKQAILYRDTVKQRYIEAMCDEYFKFYHGNSYTNFDFELASNDWNTIEMVSVNSKNEVIGFMSAEINRDTKNITGFGVMNFTKNPNIIFAKDMLKFMKMLKYNYNANKFEFCAYTGSPAEGFYKRFIEKHGGNVIGIKRRSQVLSDGHYYDSTLFEILREDMRF